MTDLRERLNRGPYALSRQESWARLGSELTELTDFHRQHCQEYRRFLDAVGCRAGDALTPETVPMLPVSIFKELSLKSVPDNTVRTVLTSSGTTGQQVSRIYLDDETALLQKEALCHIVSDFIGPDRLPFLVLDCKKVLRDRAMFSARGAGILGFSILASRTCYALDDEMKLDLPAVRSFLDKHQGKPILLFGFTFMVWKHVIRELEAQGERLEIPKGILIHGGGWKKLAGEAVSPAEFKDRVQSATGVEQVYNYYGMAEQTGCIYMECRFGHLHASVWSDVIPRRGKDYAPCEIGESGVLQVVSPLPRSYPGHSLLTEDLGVLLGVDDCPCGRKGAYFAVTGRIPRAEVRGCSDTYGG